MGNCHAMFGDEGYVDLKDSSYGMDEHKPGNVVSGR